MSQGAENFISTVDRLVDRAEALLGNKPRGKPEDTTQDQLIEPFIEALGYTRDHRVREGEIPGINGQMKWVDYFLTGEESATPLMMLEAKSLWDSGIWENNKSQVLGYLRDYLLEVETEKQAIHWILITNFRAFHVLKLNDREPFWSFGMQDLRDDEFAATLYERLSRADFSRKRLEAFHSEREKTDLGPRFLGDLKVWRLILANGFDGANAELTLDQIATASQQILNRFLFIRILEAYGREQFYSLGNLHHFWKQTFQNQPFIEQVRHKFRDTWASYNTELFDESEVDRLALPTEHIEPIILPDAYPKGRIAGQLQGQVGNSGYRSIYNYDFTTLTHDILGVAYEQFLAHDLTRTSTGIEIKEDQTLRKREGIYYTPDYIVGHIVKSALEPVADPLIHEAERLLDNEKYQQSIDKVEEIFDLNIVDPACGSGTFLLKAFEYLMHRLDEYNAEANRHQEARWENVKADNGGFAGMMDGPRPRKVDNPAERIIVEVLHGVDLDREAVSLAKLSLWTRLLRHEPGVYGRENNKLPPLQLNIRHGNSLIDHATLLPSGGMEEQCMEEQRMEAAKRVREALNTGHSEERRIEKAEGFESLCGSITERLTESLSSIFASDQQILDAVGVAYDGTETAQEVLQEAGLSVSDLRKRLIENGKSDSDESDTLSEHSAVTLAEIRDVLQNDPTVMNAVRARTPFHWEIEFPDVFSPDLDAADRGFDLMIGNPPYYNVDSHFGKGAPELRWLKHRFPASYTDKTDVLFYFFERGIEKLSEGGKLAYIVSRAFMQADKAAGLRRFMAEGAEIESVLDFLGNRVFDAGIATAIVQLSKQPPKPEHSFTACSVLELDDVRRQLRKGHPLSNLGAEALRCATVSQSDLGAAPWSFGPYASIFDRIDRRGAPLGNLDGVRIGQGIQTGSNEVFLGDFGDDFPDDRVYPRVANSKIESFGVAPLDEQLLYVDGDDEEFDALPAVVREYLQQHENTLRGRAAAERGTCQWYALQHPRKTSTRSHFVSKILAPYRAPENRFAADPAGDLAGTQDTTAIYVAPEAPSIHALAALLNSKVLNFRYRALGGIGKLTGKGMFEYFENQVRRLPIPAPQDHEEAFGRLAERGQTAHELQALRRAVCVATIRAATSIVSTETTLEEYADPAGPFGDIVRWESPDAGYVGHLKSLAVRATGDGFTIRGQVTEDPDWQEGEYEWNTIAEVGIRHDALRRHLLACAVYTAEFDETLSRKRKLTGSEVENVVTAAFRTITCYRFDTEKQHNLVTMERLLERVEEEAGRADLETVMVELQNARAEIDSLCLDLYDVEEHEEAIEQALKVVL